MRRLEEFVTETQYGTAERANEEGRGLPILRMGNITSEGQIDLSSLKHIELGERDVSRFTVRRGDVLFNRTNSPDLVGKTAAWDRDEPFAFAGYLVRVRVDDRQCTPRFLAHMMNTPQLKSQLRARAKQSINMSNISASELLRFSIPVPTLRAQERIVEILDRAEALRARRRSAIALLDSLSESAFREMFWSNSVRWPACTLGEILTAIEGGWSPECEPRSPLEDEWGVLKLGAVSSGRFVDTESKALPLHLQAKPQLEVRKGDLLFARKNTLELVGKVVVVFSVRSRLMLSDLIFRLVPNRDLVEPEYLCGLLSMSAFRPRLVALASGSAASMSNISKERLRSLEIPLPPLERQRRFTQHVVALENVRERLIRSEQSTNELFSSLQHRAFNGTL